jgi:EmrB/QacA subfamily drug resistance transporter
MRGLAYQWRVLLVVSLGTFMVVLDSTIVNIALPKISAVFSASTDQIDIVLTGYTLALAITMPATGYVSQRLGLRRAYAATVAGFVLGSALCGLSQNLGMLALARVLQGFGGGMIQPLSMATLFSATPPEQRGKMTGLFGLSLMVAPILGPTLGGYLVEFVDWRWVFYVNLPVGCLGILLALILLRDSPTRRAGSFDLLGFALAAICTSAALLAATNAPKDTYAGWTDPRILALLAVSAVTLPIFVWWELRAREPLLDVRLFAIPGFSIAGAVNLTVTGAMFGGIFLLPLFLQSPGLRDLGAWEAGLLLFPQALGTAPMSVISGRLYDKIGPRPLILVGLLVLAFASWQLVGLDLTTPDLKLQLILVLRGAGTGLAIMPATTAWLAAAPEERTQAASTFANVLRQVCASFSTAAMASLLKSRQELHESTMGMAVRWDSPGVTQLVNQAQQTAQAHGAGLAATKASVVAQLSGWIQQAASLKSFDDCFYVITAACLLALLPALFIGRGSATAGGPVEP